MSYRYPTETPMVYLKPEAMHLSTTPTLVTTVLGSCVSVTMFIRHLKIGAICHALMPHCPDYKNCKAGHCSEFKYVDCSIRKMLHHLERYKIKRSELQIKVFGGSELLASLGRSSDSIGVGRKNVKAALQTLQSEGLSIAAYDTGGVRGRKLFFYTHTGEVFLKILEKTKS
jgi:chemotaxis protein CheD